MVKNKLIQIKIAILIFVILFIQSTYSISASDKVYFSSAQLSVDSEKKQFDPRPIILKRYLDDHKSPLAEYSEEFVKFADDNELDWRLVASISGVESTFGKRIPKNSYNAYGWANGKYYFESWEDSIEHVSKYLKDHYVNDGLTSVEDIGKRYASSPDWSWKVRYFQSEIEPLPLEFTL